MNEFFSRFIKQMHPRTPQEGTCHTPLAEPARDWMYILALRCALLLAAALLGAYMYFATETISIDPTVRTPAAEVKLLSPAALSSAISELSARAAEQAQLLGAPPVVTDPSR